MLNVIQYLVDMGPAVMLPIIIFIVGLLLKQGVGRSIRAGLTIGVGFIGIGMVVDLLNNALGPAAKAMAENFNLGLNIIDLGWPGTAPFAWASNMGLIAIPIAILVNIVMLLFKWTRVVNVDIWNIWHMAFTGAMMQIATGSYKWGIVGVIVHAAIAYKLGDMYGAVTDNYFGLDGIAVPHGTSAYMGVIAKPVDDLIERIPGVRDIQVDGEFVEKYIGVFGEPTIIGAVLGFIIGLMAKYTIADALQLAVQLSAVMLLMPIVVKFIMQGLLPISEAAKKQLHKRFGDDTLKIGMDPALLLGDPQVISTGLLFVPLTLIIAALIPGNRVLPFGDLATIGFFIAMATAIHKGNIFRTLISGSIIMTMTIWISNQMAEVQSALGHAVGLVDKAETVSSLDQAGSPITYGLIEVARANISIGFIIVMVIYIACFAYTFIQYKKNRLYEE